MRLQTLLIYLVSISKMVAGTYLAYFNEHSKGGIELTKDNQIRTKELENVTMCFKFQLFDARAHCLFDVTSIQLLYLHPYNPGYGILRIKNKADRTVVFSPLQTFQVKKWYQVCLSIALVNKTSHVSFFWDGQQILDEQKVGADAIKGPLFFNQTNLLGACSHTGLSTNQPMQPVRMRGMIADFMLWTDFDKELMKNLTRDCKTSFDTLPDPILHQEKLGKVGRNVSTYVIPDDDVCKWKTLELPMLFKYNENFAKHRSWCNFFGGTMFLPNRSVDFLKMNENIATANLFTHVFGNDFCAKFWIDLKKVGEDKDLNWVTNSNLKASFLPFAEGEPNGGMFQQCIATRLENNTSEYFDQDCVRDNACSLCMIPQVRRFTLRGLPKRFDVDTFYILNNAISNRLTKEITFTGLTESTISYKLKNGQFKVKTNGRIMIETKTAQANGILTNVTLKRWPTKTKDTFGVSLKFTTVSKSYI